MAEKLFLVSAFLFLSFLGVSIFYLSSEISNNPLTGHAIKGDFLVPDKIELLGEAGACSIDGCDSSLRNIIDDNSKTFWSSNESVEILIDYETIVSGGEYKIIYSWNGEENSSCSCFVFSSLDGIEFKEVLNESNNGVVSNKVLNLEKFRYIKISSDENCPKIYINKFKIENII